MLKTFAILVAEHFAGALIFLSLLWILMRVKDGQILTIGLMWWLGGLFATAFISAFLRFNAIFILGREAALQPEGAMGIIFFLALPCFVAYCVCEFLRTRATPVAKGAKKAIGPQEPGKELDTELRGNEENI